MALSDIKVEVCVFAFDLLYLDGQPLIQRELNVRREVEFLLLLSISDSLLLSFCVCGGGGGVHAVQLLLMVKHIFSLLFLLVCAHVCCTI